MSPLDQIDIDQYQDDEPNGGEMSFVDHLEQLRWHIVRSAVAILTFAFVAFYMMDRIFSWIVFAPLHNNFFTYRAFCWLSHRMLHNDSMCITVKPFTIINTEMAGQFTTAMTMSIYCGIILAFPYVAWELWRFVKPGLSKKEMRFTRGLVFYMTALFFSGVLFGYYLMVPSALQFFSNFQISQTGEVSNFFALDNYLGFVSGYAMISGVVFELPVAVYFLSKLGLLTPDLMRRYRRYAIVIMTVLATIITPGSDIPSTILVFCPMYFLFEVSIFVSARVERQRADYFA